MAYDNTSSAEVKNFKDTLNLPRTDFPIRPQAAIDDPLMLARWEKERLYTRSFYKHEGNQTFILHDGPPYANGHIHLGHAYNKILKDIVGKSQRMFAKQAPITPGWDCHGLPIEIKVTQEHPGLSRTELKKACRVYAQHWIDVQRAEFKRLGVLMDWDRPYITMSYAYEAATLRAFGEFVAGGYIERKNKTVPWCYHCKTVLAQAEIEYKERKDPSIYVLFPLVQQAVDTLFPHLAGNSVHFLVWTTTPWTLPLNRAVLLRPDTHYVVLNLNGSYVIIAKDLAHKVAALVNGSPDHYGEVSSHEFIKQQVQARHPFITDLEVPVILDQSVMIDEGTACVHCAPGAGPDDYDIGVKHGLAIYSPVGPDGKYTQEVQPVELVGMSIDDGQIWVIKKLSELQRLLFKTSIRHSYPHCWRCHHGLIFRATKQWFCDLSRNNLKERVVEAIDTITTVPENSSNRLRATIEGRLEWCLSRQRVWGTPIPAIVCTACDYAHTSQELVEKVAHGVEKEGIEFWDTVSLRDLIPAPFSCPSCKGTGWEKEYDILDVWFDAGISHYAVLLHNKELRFPADMYLEGKDQHRGWFQSSLLSSMALEGVPSMKTIMTHGFTVDARGQKMSKSLGNVVAPEELIKKLGTDGLRLWVASIDCAGDAVVSDILINNVQEVFRKIRNTCRFLLSNLYDFNVETDAVAMDDLHVLDYYALRELARIQKIVCDAYGIYNITGVFHKLGDYCAVNLSSRYLDIIKDRLYCDEAHGHARRSAQTACWYIIDSLTRLMAPIMSFTAEQVSDLYQTHKTESIHLQKFAALPKVFEENLGNDEPIWLLLDTIRSAVLKSIEPYREKGIIKHPLEAQIFISLETMKDYALLQNFFIDLERREQSIEEFMKEFFIVSKVTMADQAALEKTLVPGLYVRVEHAAGTKCPRCWQWEETTDPDGLDIRCQRIVR